MRTRLSVVVTLWALVLASVGAGGCGDASSSSSTGELRVCAAASMTDLLPALAQAWREQDASRPRIVPVVGGSGTLARQLAEGLPADVFISANEQWSDYAASHGALRDGSTRELFANRLVMIAPAGSGSGEVTAAGGDADQVVADALRSLPGNAHLAIANPDTVPAGDWTRRALTARGLWQLAAPRSLQLPHVRACLSAVVDGEVPLGFVYASDATAAGDRVRVLATFDDTRVVYVGAVVRQARNATAAAAFLEWIATAAAAKNRIKATGFLAVE